MVEKNQKKSNWGHVKMIGKYNFLVLGHLSWAHSGPPSHGLTMAALATKAQLALRRPKSPGPRHAALGRSSVPTSQQVRHTRWGGASAGRLGGLGKPFGGAGPAFPGLHGQVVDCGSRTGLLSRLAGWSPPTPTFVTRPLAARCPAV